MKDRVLVSATLIVDDETGCYGQGDLDYTVPATTEAWLNGASGRPRELADWLRMLARCCEEREAPFADTERPAQEK